jgi:gas vesicle protein
MKTTHVIAAIVAGMAAGATIGILFAPDKGSATRSKITSAGSDLADKLTDGFHDMLDSVMGKYKEAKEDYQDMKTDMKEKKAHMTN